MLRQKRLCFWISVLSLFAPFLVGAQTTYLQMGLASYYSDWFHGRVTTSGEQYNKNGFTAAHLTLEFGTMLRVYNLANGKEVIVRVNDRGPFAHNRVIDLSKAAAHKLDILASGTCLVKIEVVETPEDLESPPLLASAEPTLSAQAHQAAVHPTVAHPAVASPPPTANPPAQPQQTDWSLYFGKEDVKNRGTYDMKGRLVVMEDKYGVQVGSFSEMAHALQRCRELEQAGILNVYLQVAPMSDNITFYRVVAGAYPSRAESNERLDHISARGFDGFTVRHY